MTDLAHLIQDLRAEAPNASPEHGRLMRAAAAALDRIAGLVPIDVHPAPFPPPELGPRRVKGAPCS